MCGIGGIIGARLERGDLERRLRVMESALYHRGPDDSGVFVAKMPGTGMTSTRLAILDLSPAGHQPMVSADGRFCIVFNGEIYNFEALRGELEREGAVFKSHSDTEVILQMYERYGADCVREFEGMFALAIWDEKERSCLLARGPLGVKPLYYFHDRTAFVFASEVRTLLASGLVPRELCGEALREYFLFGAVSEPQTLVQNVVALTPGHHLTWRDGSIRTTVYWDIHFDREPATRESAAATVRLALKDSVDRHLVSDVPVGIFLSGGLDSTALLALIAQHRRRDIQTFCISVDSPELDEGQLARRTAEHFGTNHFEWHLDSETAKGLLNQFLKCSDQPSIDGFNTFCVAKFAHEQGAKVVLSGLGGDELFGGYPSFQTVPRMVRASRFCNVVGIARAGAGRVIERRGASPRVRRAGSFLAERPTSAAAYWCMRGIFTPREADALLNKYDPAGGIGGHRPPLQRKSGSPLQEKMEHPDGAYYHIPTQPTLADEVSYLELTRYMRNQLLRDSDVMSMAWSLELRVPFVDGKLISAVSGIPAEFRLARGKRILLDAVPEIPEWVRDRPKRGFTFPFRDWSTGEWHDVFERIDAESPVRLQSWYRRWCIYALESFLERNEIRSSGLAKAA